ncbi:MAG: hypothetical protein O3C57_03460, partial [Verrucomicrobia bacterium]|nr:hypothetical protein [Verrucomicrobiota bacterium]
SGVNYQYCAFSQHPRVSVIIPSLDGSRNGNVQALLEDLASQSFSELEVIIVVGVDPQGKAINEGVKISAGSTLIMIDDDIRMGTTSTLASLAHIIDTNPEVGMVGASVVPPPDSNPLQRRMASEMPRLGMAIVDELTPSDMPCHGCCAMPKALFESIGGENEMILRGIDPDLRFRIRKVGKLTALAPHSVAYHPLPSTLPKMVSLFFRNGRGSAYIQRVRPDLVYDTSEDTRLVSSPKQHGFDHRVVRYPLRFFGRLLQGHFLRMLGDVIYAAGYVYEWIAGNRLLAARTPGRD